MSFLKGRSLVQVCGGSTAGGGETYFRNFLKDYPGEYALLELFGHNGSIKRDYPGRYVSLQKDTGVISLIRMFFSYSAYLNKNKPDVINAQDHISLVYTLILSYIPFVHKPKALFYTKHDPKGRKYFIYDYIQQIYFNKCKAVICISDTTKKSLEKYHKGNFVRIYNGITIQDECEEFPVPHRFIFFFGRLVKKKGIATLLEAFRNSKIFGSFQLLMAGPPGEQEILSAIKSTPNTAYLGIVDRAKRNFLLKKADMVVIPSLVEGFGYTAIEALYFRKKPKTLIVSDIEVFREILLDGPTYFKANNSADLKDKIEFVFENSERFEPDDAGKSILEEFSAKKMMKAYFSLYNQ